MAVQDFWLRHQQLDFKCSHSEHWFFLWQFLVESRDKKLQRVLFVRQIRSSWQSFLHLNYHRYLSLIAIKDSFFNFVGRVYNILQEFYFCDTFKQSITSFSFCVTSWDVILFPWFPIDQRITKENAGSRSAFSCFFHRMQNHCQWRWALLSFVQLWAWWVCHWSLCPELRKLE